jgi:hephaestin
MAGCFGDDTPAQPPSSTTSYVGQTREYWIQAEDVLWDYAPSFPINVCTGQPCDDTANVFVAPGPDRIGHRYFKALYRGYTPNFGRRLNHPADLGTLGPVITAAVGDTIVVHFRNRAQFPASLHPHGVFYNKANEGAPYNDGTSGNDKGDDAVAPGATRTYTWAVPERAGPGPNDGSSVFWMYHSHTDEVMDTYTGLMGPMVITAAGKARSSGSPADIDVQRFTMFLVFDENQSHYLDRNIQLAGDPGSIDPEDDEFIESNLMHSINGYVFCNLPGLNMRLGDRVRWNVMGMGTEVDLHTPHWHGNTVLFHGLRQDVVELLPATTLVADMQPDDPGTWLYHCHVNDHILAGMQALYRVSQ